MDAARWRPLQALARAVADPTDAAYGRYLSQAQLAEAIGTAQAAQGALEHLRRSVGGGREGGGGSEKCGKRGGVGKGGGISNGDLPIDFFQFPCGEWSWSHGTSDVRGLGICLPPGLSPKGQKDDER